MDQHQGYFRSFCLTTSRTALLLGFALAVPAEGASLVLFNTGVSSPNQADGSNSTVLVSGGAIDQHYSIAGSLSSGQGHVVRDQSAYTATDGTAAFINLTGSGQSNQAIGHYAYTTAFEIPLSLDPATATISGRFAVDDGITNILNRAVRGGLVVTTDVRAIRAEVAACVISCVRDQCEAK